VTFESGSAENEGLVTVLSAVRREARGTGGCCQPEGIFCDLMQGAVRLKKDVVLEFCKVIGDRPQGWGGTVSEKRSD